MCYDATARKRAGRLGVIALILSAIVGLTAGPSCDEDAANTFRKTATGPVGEGVKTITDGIIDGMIAAIENAGDDDEAESSSARSSN